jgi:hypothetical protein
MANDKPLLLSAIVGSKIAIAIMTLFSAHHYLGIEVKGDVEKGKKRTRSQHSVCLSVDDKEVVKSTNPKPRSPIIKWEWTTDNKMWVLGLSMSSLVDIHLSESAGSIRRR